MRKLKFMGQYTLCLTLLAQQAFACYKDPAKALAASKGAMDAFPYKNNIAMLVSENGEQAGALLINGRFALTVLHSQMVINPKVKAFITNRYVTHVASLETGALDYDKTVAKMTEDDPTSFSTFKLHPLCEAQFISKPGKAMKLRIPENETEFKQSTETLVAAFKDQLSTTKVKHFRDQAIKCHDGSYLESSFDLALIELDKPIPGITPIDLSSLLADGTEFKSSFLYSKRPGYIKNSEGETLMAKAPQLYPEKGILHTKTLPFVVNMSVTPYSEGKCSKYYGEFVSLGGQEEAFNIPLTCAGPQSSLAASDLLGKGIGGFSGCPLFARSQEDGRYILLGFYSKESINSCLELQPILVAIYHGIKNELIKAKWATFVQQHYLPLTKQALPTLDVFEALTKERIEIINKRIKERAAHKIQTALKALMRHKKSKHLRSQPETSSEAVAEELVPTTETTTSSTGSDQ